MAARGQYQIESRIKKRSQHLGWDLFVRKQNRALGVSGGWGKRPTCDYFGPATILNLYRIAHFESTVDKWDNSPSVHCESAKDRGEYRQAAGAGAQRVRTKKSHPRKALPRLKFDKRPPWCCVRGTSSKGAWVRRAQARGQRPSCSARMRRAHNDRHKGETNERTRSAGSLAEGL
jgi:hypothetical protein